MSESLTELRDRYFESLVGWVPFQRVVIFLFVLLAVVAPRSSGDSGFLLGLASIRIDTLLTSDDAILFGSRIGDVVVALVGAAAIGYAMHWLRMISFRW